MLQKLVMFILLVLAASIAWADTGATLLADPEQGLAPLTVSFTIDSADTPAAYSWDFDTDGTVDSTEAQLTHTYSTAGTYLATVEVTFTNGTVTLHQNIIVESLAVTISAEPLSGKAPLTVQFTADTSSEVPLNYAWDFNNDSTVDSIAQNPRHTFDNPGDYAVVFTADDGHGRNVTKALNIEVASDQPSINITSYFPRTLAQGEQDITFLIRNQGREALQDVKAKVIGPGLQHISSTAIEELGSGDEDSITVRIKILQEGTLRGTVKIAGTNYPVEFTVAQTVKYNPDELQQLLNQLKAKLQEQEAIYADKKAKGFGVTEVYDSFKSIKEQLRSAEEKILTGKLAEAKVSLDLVGTALEETKVNLQLAKKQEQTLMMWLKDNALAITAIVAAIGTLSGIMIKLTHHAKKVGENVKQKIMVKRTITSSTHPAPGTQVIKEVVETSDAPPEEKKEEEGKKDAKG
ncbi:PKD domain-containing protein [Candidatus Woesearchaeota archaeon]|nr:PKD domain-containing protein [Candidatus Woesearchaeota archaeon]